LISASDSLTYRLLAQATRGDEDARQALLELYRDNLRRVVKGRLDRRIAPRVDVSDVVQEILVEASRRLDEYLRARPMPYFAWLRRLAEKWVISTHRRHAYTGRRSVYRERLETGTSEYSAADPLASLPADDTSPSNQLIRKELPKQLEKSLSSISPKDREVLLMRYIQQLKAPEIARALGISEAAVKSRLVRGLLRLREIMDLDS
jgi:RNA polymerase sigma-70 factor (ECF subfamily)